MSDQRIEGIAEIDRVIRQVIAEQISEVLQDYVSVIIRLQEPIGVVEVVLVNIVEGSHVSCRQMLSSLARAEVDDRKSGIVFIADEWYFIPPSCHVSGRAATRICSPSLQVECNRENRIPGTDICKVLTFGRGFKPWKTEHFNF